MAKTITKKLNQEVCKAAESVAEVVQNNQLAVAYHFPSAIYLIDRPDFLTSVNKVSEEKIKIQKDIKDLDEIYPVFMSENYASDPRVKEFAAFVGSTAWNILNDQGYAMQNKATSFLEMWTQEHQKHSLMDTHVHANGAQIVGFYFLETPENCSKTVFHDPRVAKVQIDLPEQDINSLSVANKAVNFTPRPGLLIFAPSWLAHSFSRHASELPIKFVHFSLTTITTPQQVCPASAEVI
jgi:uncharacterized protein (TIGR02466 family)